MTFATTTNRNIILITVTNVMLLFRSTLSLQYPYTKNNTRSVLESALNVVYNDFIFCQISAYSSLVMLAVKREFATFNKAFQI